MLIGLHGCRTVTSAAFKKPVLCQSAAHFLLVSTNHVHHHLEGGSGWGIGLAFLPKVKVLSPLPPDPGLGARSLWV